MEEWEIMFKTKKVKELEKQLLAAQKENERLNGQVDFYKNSAEINRNLNEILKMNIEMHEEIKANKDKSKIDGFTINLSDRYIASVVSSQESKEQSVRHATQEDFQNF